MQRCYSEWWYQTFQVSDDLRQRADDVVGPIVLCNGVSKWTAATDIADLIPRAPGLVAAIMRVEQPPDSKALFALIDVLNDWLADNPELRKVFAVWIRAVVLRRSKHAVVLPKIDDLKELKMTLAERFETWAEEFEQRGMEKGIQKGIEKGIEQGIIKGETLLLQRLLVKRFGPLSDDVVHQISQASVAQVYAWADRVLDAQSLEDVLRVP